MIVKYSRNPQVLMKNNVEILAMDFDGVIAKSILEYAISGYNGYEAYCGNNF